MKDQQRPRIFTWHVHGSYLYYLSQGDYDIFIPVLPQRTAGYYGRGPTVPFGENVHEIPVDTVRHQLFDVMLYQSAHNYIQAQLYVLCTAKHAMPPILLAD